MYWWLPSFDACAGRTASVELAVRARFNPAPAHPSATPMTPSTASNGLDRTHLGRKGAHLFATIVEQDVIRAVPALAKAVETPESRVPAVLQW